MKQSLLLSALCYTFLSIVVSPEKLFGQEDQLIVEDTYSVEAFPLVHKNLATSIYVDGNDFEVVRIASEDLRKDIGKVTGVMPEVMNRPGASNYLVIAGTLDRCEFWLNFLIRKR